jgi:adenylosuccinate synthase
MIFAPVSMVIKFLKFNFKGGANAGHTVVANNKKYAFHLLPCGILYKNCINILGNGVVVNVKSMLDELK